MALLTIFENGCRYSFERSEGRLSGYDLAGKGTNEEKANCAALPGAPLFSLSAAMWLSYTLECVRVCSATGKDFAVNP